MQILDVNSVSGYSRSGCRVQFVASAYALVALAFAGEGAEGSINFSQKFPVLNSADCTSRKKGYLVPVSVISQGFGWDELLNRFSGLKKTKSYQRGLLLILLAMPIAELTVLGSEC